MSEIDQNTDREKEIDKTAEQEERSALKSNSLIGGVFSQRGAGKKTGSSSSRDKNIRPEEEVRKLNKTELLEMLIEETKEAERLRIENERLTEELARCKADLDRTASLDKIIERLRQIVDGR